jgi:Family of unknown function (DUF6364)
MKKPVTFRMDQDLIEKAKVSARAENRTLTNFVETLLKLEVERRNQAAPAAAGKVEDSHAI